MPQTQHYNINLACTVFVDVILYSNECRRFHLRELPIVYV